MEMREDNLNKYHPSRSHMRGFPGSPVVKACSFTAGDMSSISGQGTKIPHAKEKSSDWTLWAFSVSHQITIEGFIS